MCVPYSNAEIYNSTCCDSFDSLKFDPSDLLSLFRVSLLKMVCENESVKNCNLSFTPTITLDDPFNQTKQSIKDTVINTPYLYTKVYQKITCKNLNNGSRGFGYWNTTIDLKNTSIAWFIQLSGEKDESLNGFYIQCQKPMINETDLPISFTKIQDLDENEHSYMIDWKKDSIDFYVDDVIVHTETKNVPNKNMAYHNWVDNSTFTYKNNALVHIIHKTDKEKSNIIKDLQIYL